MFRMSTAIAAIFVAGLLGPACTNQAGLNSGGSLGGAGEAAKGGQTGGVTGGSGGTIGSGPVGTAGTSGTGGSGGTGPCLPVACPALYCVGGFRPNPDPCGCPLCGPSPDAGVAKDARGPDAATKGAGSPDAPICPGPVPACVPPPYTCPAGYQLSSPPCGCAGCVPVDGGTVADGGKPDAPLVCNVMCPVLACVGGYLPNPEPCGCPTCAPNSDAGVASPDAGLACCPAGFTLYGCQEQDGAPGLACHNPALGCASSKMCGQGCDPQVSGRCQCVDNVLCIRGDRFDTTLCKCVPDTTPSCSSASDCTGAVPALCQLCANGGYGCAHFACVAGQCQLAYCP